MPDLQRVLNIIAEMANKLPNHGLMLNERYIHHFFSHRMQSEYEHTSTTAHFWGQKERIMLHPEWPTYKKSTNIFFGRYRKNGTKYYPVDEGQQGGFIDFAVGDYGRPKIAVEFTLKPSWSNEETVYDFVKLLDSRNSSVKVAVSFGVILRQNGLPTGNHVDNFKNSANNAYREAVRRLGCRCCDRNRKRFLLISEIAADERRHWCFNTENGEGGFDIADQVPPAGWKQRQMRWTNHMESQHIT